MPKQLIRLPEFHLSEKGWDASPFTNALKDWSDSRERQRQFDATKDQQDRQFQATNAIREQQLKLQGDQVDLSRQRANREDIESDEKRLKDRVNIYAGIAQAIQEEPQPDIKAAMWGKLRMAHPEFNNMLAKYDVDPNDHDMGSKFIIAQAQQYQDPQKKTLMQAQTETQRAYGESAAALRDERRQSTLNMQRGQMPDSEAPGLNADGELVMRPRVQEAAMRFPSGAEPPPGTFREVEPAQAPGVAVERGGRLTREQQRQQTVNELDSAVKGGERVPTEAEIQRYWSAVYGQKPPSGQKYGRDGGYINMNVKGGGDKTRDAIKGALESAQGGINDAREVLRGTNMVQRGLSYMTDVGVAARVQGPIRIAIRGVLHGISGAQINIPEQQEYFDTMLPGKGDSINTVEFKLNHLETILKNIQKIQGTATPEEVLEVRNAMRKNLGLPPLSLEDAGKRLDSRGKGDGSGWSIKRIN